MSAASLYQQLFYDMDDVEDQYYIPFRCKIYMGIILMASIVMYHHNHKNRQKKSNKSGPTSPTTHSSNKTSKSTYNLNNDHHSHSPSSNISHPRSPLHPHSHSHLSAHNNIDSAVPNSSLSHSFSTSILERTNIPNQKYRKQDPQTRYDDDGTRYQCVSVPYRINPETNKVCLSYRVSVQSISSRSDFVYINNI